MFATVLKNNCLSFLVIVSASFFYADTAAAQKAKHAKPASTHFQFKTLIIDAGHGGKDPGAHGATSKEKDVALSIARKLRDMVNNEMPSVKTIMTRKTDVFIELHKRTDIANDAHGNLFISIHCNSSPAKKAKEHGALLLVYGFHRSGEQREALRENGSIFLEDDYKDKYNGYGDDAVVNTIVLNAYQQKYRKQSIRFGDLVDHQFKKADGRHSFGVKEQGVLVLAQSGMPAVLVETGFINNPTDEAYLNSKDGQFEIVTSIFRALKEYRAGLEGN
jgi:N-acetylmuramoyl-L-alanine amidase